MACGTLMIEGLLNSKIQEPENKIFSHQEGPLLYMSRLNIWNLKGGEDACYGRDLQDEDSMLLSNIDIHLSY